VVVLQGGGGVGWGVCERSAWGGPCVREVLSWGMFSRYRKKEPKQNILFSFYFWMQQVWFLMVVAYVNLLGAVGVICLAKECPCRSC
jgi:hypothetical protein